MGPPGTGKTHLAQAIGYAAIKQGRTALYRSIFEVVRDFIHEEALGDEDATLARYLRPDLLIIDDMGMNQLPKRIGTRGFFRPIPPTRWPVLARRMTKSVARKGVWVQVPPPAFVLSGF
jgi:chromosomal replication initiation ATPase DnaA